MLFKISLVRGVEAQVGLVRLCQLRHGFQAEADDGEEYDGDGDDRHEPRRPAAVRLLEQQPYFPLQPVLGQDLPLAVEHVRGRPALRELLV